MMQIIFGLKKITEFKGKILKLSHLFFCRFSQFCNIHPQSIAMVNIHDLVDKKVSLSFNVFVFVFFLIAVKPNWHHQTFP